MAGTRLLVLPQFLKSVIFYIQEEGGREGRIILSPLEIESSDGTERAGACVANDNITRRASSILTYRVVTSPVCASMENLIRSPGALTNAYVMVPPLSGGSLSNALT